MSNVRTAALVGYKLTSDAAGRLAVFAALILAARALAATEFGLLSLFTTIGWIGAAAGDFGLQLYLARRIVTAGLAPGAAFWPLLRLRLLTMVVTLGAATALAVGLAPGAWAACAMVAAAPLVTSVAEFIHYGFRAIHRSDLESSLSLAQRVITLALAAALLHRDPSLGSMSLVLFLPACGAVAGAIGVAARLLPSPAPTRPALSWRTWLDEVAPIGTGILLSVAYFRLDIALLTRWSGLTEVAAYGAVFRLLEAFRMLPAAVVSVLLPRLLDARAPGFAPRLALGLCAAGAVAALVVAPWAQPLVHVVYEGRYDHAARTLQVLLLALPLLGLNAALTHLLISRGAQRAYAATCAAALVANLGANTVLIPAWGGLGAAWATLVTEAVVTAGCFAGLQRARTSR